MLSHLLDVLDEQNDADTLDSLLDQLDDLFFNLILYYYQAKPSSLQISRSSSTSSTSSPPLLPQRSDIDYTLQEKTLCNKVAKFTAMHESHIFDCYNQIKSTAIDTFAITEIQVWHYVFEERQRMFNSLISMLNYVINNNDASNQRFADAISNHIHTLMNKGWRKNIVLCYTKLTADGMPDHLPTSLRGKYCEYIAEEQLLLWKLVFLLYYEPIRGELTDIDMYFELYGLSLKKVIQIYISNALLPNIYESQTIIYEIMKKIDDLLIAVFMGLLPIESVHAIVDVDDIKCYVDPPQKIEQIKMDLKLAQPDNLPLICKKLENAFGKSQSNNHLTNIWKIYSDIGFKLAKYIKLIDDYHTHKKQASEKKLPHNYDIYDEIDKINNNISDNDSFDAITYANLINCFEKILITFGDCDDSKCFIQPMQCLIRSYLDAILLKDPEVLVDANNIHCIYQHILCDNHKLSNKFFKHNTLNRFSLWQYAWKSFQTQPYLMLGFLAALCSSKHTAQKVYQRFRDNFGYFTVKSQIMDYIKQTKDNPPQYIAKDTFEWNYIIIKRGTIGHIMKGRDGITQIICWDTHWNGFLWLLSLLTHCINKHKNINKHNNNISQMNQSFAVSKHNIAYMSHNTLPSAMRLLTKLTYYYPEAIQLINDDIKLVKEAAYRRANYITDKKLYLQSHSQKLFRNICNNGGINLMSFQLFTHCMQRLKEYDYSSHSITNALHSTKDNYDWNLDLFKDATEFFKFMTYQSIDYIVKILYDFDKNDHGFFSKLIITAIQVLAQCIQNTNNQQYGDDAYEKSQYQLKCVWNIIGYIIDIVNKIFINRNVFYFQEWNLDIFEYIQTLFNIYPMFYPMTSFNVKINDKTTLHSYSIELHCKATELIYNVSKSKEFGSFVINKFCNDNNDNGFGDFIIDPIIFSNEILTFVRSQIRSKDETLVCKIITDSMKILENILINLEINQRQEIIIKISHKLNDPNSEAFERISLADKLCQFMQQSQKYNNTIIVNQCIKFLKFLCHIFPANSQFPYHNLFTSMTEIQRLSDWMTKYLYIDKWRLVTDIKRACNLVDLLCIFMSNQNRLRHILLKDQPNILLKLLFKIIKHENAFNKFAHITAKCLQIFWLLHSDFDAAIDEFILTTNNNLWQPICNILSADLQIISTFNDNIRLQSETDKSSFIMGRKIELEYVNRCWQNECFCWCFSILLQEIEQTLSFFDEIDSKYMNRRKNINKLIHKLTIDEKLLMKWMKIMVNIPAINVNLLKKRSNICIDFRINFQDYQSDALRLYGDYKDYGRNCVDKYKSLINKLNLLSKSAHLAKLERNSKQKQKQKQQQQQQQHNRQSGHKRKHFDIFGNRTEIPFNMVMDTLNNNNNKSQSHLRLIPNLHNVTYYVEIIEQFNLQKSLVFSHNLMLSSWTNLMTHICLCSPHIIGLLPITCYNNKLSKNHLETTINKIKLITKQQQTNKQFISPTKRELNQEESIKQLFHWNILKSLPKPKRQSKLPSYFTVELSKMLHKAFKYMMDPQYFNAHKRFKYNDDDDNKHDEKTDEFQYINLEEMANSNDLENYLCEYLCIIRVLRDIVNHLTQDIDENNMSDVLTFDICKNIFINISECIKIASEFSYNRIHKTIQQPSPKKRLYATEIGHNKTIEIIDSIIELLLMISMVIIKWMLHYGPKLDMEQDPNTSFLSSMKKKRPHFSKWKSTKNITTPIKKRLFQNENDINDNNDKMENDDNDSDEDVLIDMNISNVSNISNISTTSQILSNNNPWFSSIRGCLMILGVLTSTSTHLIIGNNNNNNDNNNIGVSIFPYLIECIPYSNLSLELISKDGFIKYCMNHFANISNNIVELFIKKEKEIASLNTEYNNIMCKLFKTKSDNKKLIELSNNKILISKQYIINIFIPLISKLSSILQCFVSIAQESFLGTILLFENELLLYLTNCSIFKSNNTQFLDPYLIDNNEENPCHELWCKSLELITYLLRQTALALNTNINMDEKTNNLCSLFIQNIMQFCSVHHNRILNKIKYISNPNSDLRLRDLEEINIISSFIYEIEKNSLLISQQSLNTNIEFNLHKQRFYGLLHILLKFVIILESPEMLSSLTPPISTHEKYAFGHQIINNKPKNNYLIDDDDDNESKSTINLPPIQRQGSRHVHFSSAVVNRNNNNNNNNNFNEPEATLSIHDDDSDDDNNEQKQQQHLSPLPLGKLLRQNSMNNLIKSGSVDTNIADEEYDLQLRRDQFLQRIEYYILDILKNILFCCRYEILDNWNHKNIGTYLFTPDLRQVHFLSSSNNRPSLSVLVRLSHYSITHLKGLYQTQINEEKDNMLYDINENNNNNIGILKSTNLKRSKRKNNNRDDGMYDSKKIESEGIYNIVTWKNIEKTLWILFEHCYINLLLQIDCFMKCNEQIILKYIIQYRNCLDKLWKRITRFETFLIENNIIIINNNQQNQNNENYATKEMKFITVLREKQHHQLIMNIEKLRNKYMPNIIIQRQQTDQTQLSLRSHDQTQSDYDTMTDIHTTRINSSIYSPYPQFNTSRSRMSSNISNINNSQHTPTRHHFRRNASSSSNVSSSWA